MTAVSVLHYTFMRDSDNKDTPTGARVSTEKNGPYDEISDLIGSVNGLPADLSQGTGARFAEIVQESGRKP